MVKNNPIERKFISEKYQTAKGNWDLYVPFIELFLILSKSNSYVGLITPNKWLSLNYGKSIRDFVFDSIVSILDFTNERVFDSANISSIVFILSKKNPDFLYVDSRHGEPTKIFKKDIQNKDNLSLVLSNGFKLINKINKVHFNVESFFSVLSSFTTAEAYQLVEIIAEKEALKFF